MNDSIKPSYYPHLYELMIEAGDKQEDLARLFNRSPAVISNLFKTGRRLQKDEAKKLADRYNVTRVLQASPQP